MRDVTETSLFGILDDGLHCFAAPADEESDVRAIPDRGEIGAGQLVLHPEVDRAPIKAGPRYVPDHCHSLQTPDSTTSCFDQSQDRASSSGTR
jgi:hypothetical protein